MKIKHMAFYVKIRKFAEKKEAEGFLAYYYKVEGGNYGDEGCFYIKVNPNIQKIYFYSDKDLQVCVKIYKLNDPEQIVGELPGVDHYIYTRVLVQVHRALRENKFPEYLDYCA